jgi:hypothetical protein
MLAETPERGKLQGLEVNERTTLNQWQRNMMEKHELRSGSEQWQVAGCCEYGNEPWGYIKKQGMSGLADKIYASQKRLLGSQERLCTLKLIKGKRVIFTVCIPLRVQ